jgi:hypothetical protein
MIAQHTAGTLYLANGIYVDNNGNNNTSLTGSNSPTYTITVPPVLVQEVVTVPASMNTGVAFTVTITGNANDTFNITQAGVTVLSGQLDANGKYSYTNPTGFDTAGSYLYSVAFTATGHVINKTITVSQAAPPAPVYTNAVTGYPASIQVNTPFTVQCAGTPGDTILIVGWNAPPAVSGVIGSNGIATISVSPINQAVACLFTVTYGSGYRTTFTVNATAPNINETIIGPSSVLVNQPYNVSIVGGTPNDTFTITGAYSASGQLLADGTFNWIGLTQTSPGTVTAVVTFASTGHIRTYTVTVQ